MAGRPTGLRLGEVGAEVVIRIADPKSDGRNRIAPDERECQFARRPANAGCVGVF